MTRSTLTGVTSVVGGGRGRRDPLRAGRASTADAKTRVVLSAGARCWCDGRVNGVVLHGMLNEGARLLGEKDAGGGVAAPRQARDVVGVEEQRLGPLRPRPSWSGDPRGGVKAGVRAENVAVDDRACARTPFPAHDRPRQRPAHGTHAWSGLGSASERDHVRGQPADYHGDSCASLGALWQLPQLRARFASTSW